MIRLSYTKMLLTQDYIWLQDQSLPFPRRFGGWAFGCGAGVAAGTLSGDIDTLGVLATEPSGLPVPGSEAVSDMDSWLPVWGVSAIFGQIFQVWFRFYQNKPLLVADFPKKKLFLHNLTLSKDDILIVLREKIEENQAMFGKFARHDNAAAWWTLSDYYTSHTTKLEMLLASGDHGRQKAGEKAQQEFARICLKLELIYKR